MKISKGADTGQKGFTLVELLIVMAIIAVLVGITIAGLGYAMRRSRNVARMSAMTNLERALTSYYSDELEYLPSTATVADMVDGTPPLLDEYLEGSFEAPAGTVIYYKANAPTNAIYYTFCINQEQTGGSDDLYNCTGTGIGQSTFSTTSNDVDCDFTGDGGLCGYLSSCDADGCS
ncbi:MAG: type II secretion system protein [bacterium]